jgi:hypothetical protein
MLDMSVRLQDWRAWLDALVILHTGCQTIHGASRTGKGVSVPAQRCLPRRVSISSCTTVPGLLIYCHHGPGRQLAVCPQRSLAPASQTCRAIVGLVKLGTVAQLVKATRSLTGRRDFTGSTLAPHLLRCSLRAPVPALLCQRSIEP